VDIVTDDKSVTIEGVVVAGVDTLLEVVLGVLYLFGCQVEVIRRVQVKVGHDVAEVGHDVLAVSAA
jgi:hypothetical protein